MKEEKKIAIEGYNQEKIQLLKMIEVQVSKGDTWKTLDMYQRLKEIDEQIDNLLS